MKGDGVSGFPNTGGSKRLRCDGVLCSQITASYDTFTDRRNTKKHQKAVCANVNMSDLTFKIYGSPTPFVHFLSFHSFRKTSRTRMWRKDRRKRSTSFCHGPKLINSWGTQLLTDGGPGRPFGVAEAMMLFIKKSCPRPPDPMLTVSPQ